MGPVLELRGLPRSFGQLLGVDDLRFSVEAGSMFGFAGRNGAGKTTTMRIIGERLSSRVEERSHGDQTRVQLAAALVHRPDLLTSAQRP
jgi:ABC-type uncharacterized transport system ATPase subunit